MCLYACFRYGSFNHGSLERQGYLRREDKHTSNKHRLAEKEEVLLNPFHSSTFKQISRKSTPFLSRWWGHSTTLRRPREAKVFEVTDYREKLLKNAKKKLLHFDPWKSGGNAVYWRHQTHTKMSQNIDFTRPNKRKQMFSLDLKREKKNKRICLNRPRRDSNPRPLD